MLQSYWHSGLASFLCFVPVTSNLLSVHKSASTAFYCCIIGLQSGNIYTQLSNIKPRLGPFKYITVHFYIYCENVTFTYCLTLVLLQPFRWSYGSDQNRTVKAEAAQKTTVSYGSHNATQEHLLLARPRSYSSIASSLLPLIYTFTRIQIYSGNRWNQKQHL